MVENTDASNTGTGGPQGGETGGGSGGSTSRRTLLKGIGAAGAAVPFVSSRASAASSLTPYDDEYRNVVNVLDEGLDPEGEDSITDDLYDLPQDDTLLYFPYGRYRMNSRYRNTNFDKFGMVGDNAVFVPDDYEDFDDRNGSYWLFRLGTGSNPGRNLRIEDFQVDQTASQTGVRAFDAVASEELRVTDVDIRGVDDLGSEGPARFGIADPDGKGLVEKFWARDGSLRPDQVPNQDDMYMGTTGIMANWPNKGTLTFDDCRVSGFSGTGLYAAYGAGDTGRVIVDGGVFKDSGVAQIRIGGNDGFVRNAYVAILDSDPELPQQRGIRVENAAGTTRVWDTYIEATQPNGYLLNAQDGVEDLHVHRVEMHAYSGGNGITDAVHLGGSLREGQFVDCVIDNNGPGGFGLQIEESDHDDRVIVENTTIEGDAGDEAGSAGVWCARDGVEFRLVTVDQESTASNRDGFDVQGDDVLYYGVDVTAESDAITQYGDGAIMEEVYAESRSGAGVHVTQSASDTLVKESTIVGGFVDEGTGTRAWDNQTN